MGWAAFSLTRSIGGKITIIFPKVSAPISLGSKSRPILNVQQLLKIPDFPIEANIFTRGSGLDFLDSVGFSANVIDCDQYIGETWTLNNGSTIIFEDSAIRFRDPAGNEITNMSVGISNEMAIWLPCLIVDPVGGKQVSGTTTFGELSVHHPNGIWFFNNEFPKLYGSYYNSFFEGAVPIIVTDDPYDPGGESGPGGGTGDFDGTGDEISIPGIPTLSAVDAGFITLFNPSLSEMHSLASYMWSDLFDLNGWKKIFADPMGAILGLSIVPVAVPNGGVKEVTVGNISTGVSMTVAASQYVEVDCGTLNVNEYWGAYLDYDPYTKAEIYLPYIGIHPISTDDVMSKPVHVVYHVDILSGACCAYVQCGGTVLYAFIGQCASSIPITGDNWTNVINGAISIAGSIGSMVATGGASAPMAIGQIASTAVNTMKPTVEKSGAMGGTGGMLGVQTPYLILTRPRQALPKRQNEFTGYPSFITELLGDLTGYTEIEHIHLENVPATEPELSEIESILKNGVIF